MFSFSIDAIAFTNRTHFYMQSFFYPVTYAIKSNLKLIVSAVHLKFLISLQLPNRFILRTGLTSSPFRNGRIFVRTTRSGRCVWMTGSRISDEYSRGRVVYSCARLCSRPFSISLGDVLPSTKKKERKKKETKTKIKI